MIDSKEVGVIIRFLDLAFEARVIDEHTRLRMLDYLEMRAMASAQATTPKAPAPRVAAPSPEEAGTDRPDRPGTDPAEAAG